MATNVTKRRVTRGAAKVEETASERSSEHSRLVVPITLRDYWYEAISKEEALRRLATRKIDSQIRTQTENEIPERTLHFLTFNGGVLREYAQFGNGVASLLLMLPLEKKEDSYVVVMPVYNSEQMENGRTRRLSGIELHEFTSLGGKLLENGIPRPTFHYSEGPTELKVDVSFVTAGERRREGEVFLPPRSGLCCRACEWVHSALDIHRVDWLCCLFTCGERF